MSAITVTDAKLSEELMVSLANAIAMDINPLSTILEAHQVSEETWELLKDHHRFNALLTSATAEWHSALNTHERVRVKSSAIIEAWLIEATARLHDPIAMLPAKIELAKLIANLAKMGGASAKGDGPVGERFSVTINLGGDTPSLKFEKQATSQVIEGEVISST